MLNYQLFRFVLLHKIKILIAMVERSPRVHFQLYSNSFQKVAFKHFPDLHKFAIANVASVDTRAALTKYFKSLR